MIFLILIGEGERSKISDDTKLNLDAIDRLKREVKEIQLTLKNETNRNRQLIAEGHLDLSQKLDDALKNRKRNRDAVNKSDQS